MIYNKTGIDISLIMALITDVKSILEGSKDFFCCFFLAAAKSVLTIKSQISCFSDFLAQRLVS